MIILITIYAMLHNKWKQLFLQFTENILHIRAPDPSPEHRYEPIPEDKLPRCKCCGGLLRPHVVWFGENLNADILRQAGIIIHIINNLIRI
jgi:hypothetical protein